MSGFSFDVGDAAAASDGDGGDDGRDDGRDDGSDGRDGDDHDVAEDDKDGNDDGGGDADDDSTCGHWQPRAPYDVPGATLRALHTTYHSTSTTTNE